MLTMKVLHEQCMCFEPVDRIGDIASPSNYGNCAYLAEHLRLHMNTPVKYVVVDGDDIGAELDLTKQSTDYEQVVVTGCPHFQPTEAAQDAMAEMLDTIIVLETILSGKENS